MRLALFDLDKTLLGGDSDHAWGAFLVEQGLVDGDYYRQKNDDFYAQYQKGALDIDAYLAFALEFLTQHPMAHLQQLHAQFMAEKVEPMVLPKARELVKAHQDNGDTCVIVTATNDFVTAPIAGLFGIDHLLGTQAEIVDGRYTGQVVGTPCYEAGKVVRLEQWLTEQNLPPESIAHSVFYSDSQTDIPLLEWADEPVATNPNDVLKAHAQAQGWRILDLH